MDLRAYNHPSESYHPEPFQCGICYGFLTAEIDVLTAHVEEHLKQVASFTQLDHYQRSRAWQAPSQSPEVMKLPSFNRFAALPDKINSGGGEPAQSQQLGTFVNSQFSDVKVENLDAAECGGTSLSETSNWITCVDEMLSAANHGDNS